MTVKEFKELHYDNCYWDENTAEDFAIEFAKYHVKQALKEASKNGVIFLPSHPHFHGAKLIDKQSILNAYPLTNIK